MTGRLTSHTPVTSHFSTENPESSSSTASVARDSTPVTWREWWTEFRERLLESGPVWTSSFIRGRDHAHVKVHGRWRRWKWRPLYTYRVVVQDINVKAYLSYADRGTQWHVRARGEDFEKWFKDNGKGLMRYTVYPSGEGIFVFKPTAEVGFTNATTATMFKLAFGGR